MRFPTATPLVLALATLPALLAACGAVTKTSHRQAGDQDSSDASLTGGATPPRAAALPTGDCRDGPLPSGRTPPVPDRAAATLPGAPATVHTRLAGLGQTETWDGRVFIVNKTTSCGAGWYIQVFRPEALQVALGVPDFRFGTYSPPVPLEITKAYRNALSVVPNPATPTNPYRSDPEGKAVPGGAFETYDLIIFATDVDDSPTSRKLVRLTALITVAAPRTAAAKVQRATITPRVPLRTIGGKKIGGFSIEPSLTFDGRLMLFQALTSTGSQLYYSWNARPAAVDGWSVPAGLAAMHDRDAATVIDGIRFDERYPIAKESLRKPDGAFYKATDPYYGAYAWMSLDGTEIFHSATLGGNPLHPHEVATRTGASVIGRWTGYALRHIDGPLNPNRDAMTKELTVREFVTSPGAVPSFWQPYAGVKGPGLLYTQSRPVYPLFATTDGSYSEVSFEDFVDQDYVLRLPMNELINRNVAPASSLKAPSDYGRETSGQYDLARTPDTSGRFNTGSLAGGAAFPVEYAFRLAKGKKALDPDAIDENPGAIGRAVYFPETGAVVVPSSASLLETSRYLSVEIFVRRLGTGPGRDLPLLRKGNSYELILTAAGRVEASVFVGGERRSLGQVGAPLPVDRWQHVALTYDGDSGTALVYLGGNLAGQVAGLPGALDLDNAPLIVGPGPGGGAVPAPAPAVLLLDEVSVSRVVRRPEEIARSALQTLPATTYAARMPVPTGLRADLLKVPGAAPGPAEVELGKKLFFEPRLSANGTVSCASCHSPKHGYADDKPFSAGVTGRTLARNSPSLLNRAFSTRQFADGRADSLEAQALGPLTSADEMGSAIADVLQTLADVPEYREEFEAVYQSAPTAETLARALASFERTLMTGRSPVDRFEAGTGTLTGEEERGRALFRGKARCIACHNGPNYTDESYHNEGFFADDADLGRAAVTGRTKDRGAFKTPTLRNVALTAPYFHDGSVATLAAVVHLYNVGGPNPAHRDYELRPLGLSVREEDELVQFLGALTGDTAEVQPPALPPGAAAKRPARTPPVLPAEPLAAAVVYTYDLMLERTPAPAEVDLWVHDLQRGLSKAEMVVKFYDSPEFQERYTPSRRGSRSFTAFLYERLLARHPEASGWGHWVDWLDTHAMTRREAVERFVATPEFAAAHAPLN